jgi:hypothetical protein
MKTYSLNYRKTGVVLVATMFIALLFTSCKKGALDKASPTLDKVSSVNAAYPSSIASTISNGLIAYWPLSNNSVADLSGNGNNGTASSITTSADRFGNPGGASYFNGTSSYISIPDQASLRLHSTDFTISAWVKLSGPSTGSSIVTKRIGGNSTGYGMGISSTNVTFGPGGGVAAIATATVDTGRWYMVSAVYTLSNSTVKLYLNGVLVNTTTNFASPGTLTPLLYIGRDDPSTGTSGYFFKGSMSDIRMYNRAVTSTEVSELYAATCAPTSSLIGYWPLTNTLLDLSGNGNNGTGNVITSATDRLGNSLGAYYFNGTSSYISVPDQAALRLHNTDFTINAWVDLSAYNAGGGSSIFTKRTGGDVTGYGMGISASNITFGPGGGVAAIASASISLSQWYMITCEYTLSNNTLNVYLNGTLINTTTNYVSPGTLTSMLYIGKDDPSTGTTGYYFNGPMSNLRMYSRALSTTEIADLYNALD